MLSGLETSGSAREQGLWKLSVFVSYLMITFCCCVFSCIYFPFPNLDAGLLGLLSCPWHLYFQKLKQETVFLGNLSRRPMTAHCGVNDQEEGPFATPVWGLGYTLTLFNQRVRSFATAVRAVSNLEAIPMITSITIFCCGVAKHRSLCSGPSAFRSDFGEGNEKMKYTTDCKSPYVFKIGN